MIHRILRAMWTGVLAVLVGTSMVLSYFLWSGNLQKGAEIGFVQAPAMPTSANPVIEDTIRPYRVIVNIGKQYTSVRPDTSAYTTLVSLLQSVHALHPKSLSALPKDVATQVAYQFGIQINNDLGKKWLGSLIEQLTGWQCRTVDLYTEAKSPVCHVAFIGINQLGDQSVLIGSTSLSVSQVNDLAQQDLKSQPETVWNDFDAMSFIPVNGKMERLTYSVQTPALLPLVRTFFVNPQAITRIQETQNTSLWTDGSRAVQVNSGKRRLDYEDPNAGAQGIRSSDYVTAVNFLHAHGGGPNDVIGFDSFSALAVDLNSPTITFTQFVDGYPILDTVANYSLSIDSGRVLQFDRPLWQLQSVVRKKSVQIIGIKQLSMAMKKIDSKDSIKAFHVELGYTPKSVGSKKRSIDTSRLRLEPVYYVTSTSGMVWVIDAVTGSLLPGGGVN